MDIEKREKCNADIKVLCISTAEYRVRPLLTGWHFPTRQMLCESICALISHKENNLGLNIRLCANLTGFIKMENTRVVSACLVEDEGFYYTASAAVLRLRE